MILSCDIMLFSSSLKNDKLQYYLIILMWLIQFTDMVSDHQYRGESAITDHPRTNPHFSQYTKRKEQ